MSSGHQRITWRRNIAENFNPLSRVHERYRQTTDGRTTTYSEHEHEFTFAKNHEIVSWKRRTSLVVHMDALLIADDREDVWRQRRSERVGRLYATAADVQALNKSLTGVRLIKSITVTVTQSLRHCVTISGICKHEATSSRMSSTFNSCILRSGVDMSACGWTDDIGRGNTVI